MSKRYGRSRQDYSGVNNDATVCCRIIAWLHWSSDATKLSGSDTSLCLLLWGPIQDNLFRCLLLVFNAYAVQLCPTFHPGIVSPTFVRHLPISNILQSCTVLRPRGRSTGVQLSLITVWGIISRQTISDATHCTILDWPDLSINSWYMHETSDCLPAYLLSNYLCFKRLGTGQGGT